MRLEGGIHDGDLIAITTNAEGLDILHVGFAARVKNRIHLLSRLQRRGQGGPLPKDALSVSDGEQDPFRDHGGKIGR